MLLRDSLKILFQQHRPKADIGPDRIPQVLFYWLKVREFPERHVAIQNDSGLAQGIAGLSAAG
jgi:hypothetical protein